MDNSRIKTFLGHHPIDGGCAQHDADAKRAWSRDGQAGEFGIPAHRGFGVAPHHRGQIAAEANRGAGAGFVAETGTGDELDGAGGCDDGSDSDDDGDCEGDAGADCGGRGGFEGQAEFARRGHGRFAGGSLIARVVARVVWRI